ncbi:MAG: DUF6353 family protein [Ruminococcus sp.]|nr:DUF6353 family protein [Ruminococcus sp.]
MNLYFEKMARRFIMSVKKHSPEILVGIGVTGMVVSAVMVGKETPKALRLIEEKKCETGTDTLSAAESVKTVWKCYIPALLTGAASITCIICASSINLRKNAALAVAYTLSETAFRDYREQTVKTLGEKKEEEIADMAAAKSIERKPVKNSEVYITDKGNVLCFDSVSGRYFTSDIEHIRRAFNTVNHKMVTDPCGYVTLNDLYDEIGLRNTAVGDTFGWWVDKGTAEVRFSSDIADDGRPCLVLNYNMSLLN